MPATNRLLSSAIVLCLAASLPSCRAAEPVPLPKMSAEKWRADVDTFGRQLAKRHLNAFHAIPRADFERGVAELRTKSATANDDEMLVGLLQLTARVGDAHTNVALPANAHRLPVAFAKFGDEYRVTAAAEPAKALLGGRLVAIDGTPIAGILPKLRTVIAQDESEPFVQGALPGYLAITEVLHGLGIVRDPLRARITVATDAGEQSLDVQSVPLSTRPATWPNAARSTPLARTNPDDALFFTWLEPQKTIYANFRRYDDLSSRSKALWKFADAHPAAEKIVIDLRQNGGGDYTDGRKYLVSQLKARPKLKPYVLIGPRTFSAAMNNAIDFRNDTKATLVGLPIGEKPNSYQENDQFVLPESKLVVSYSTKFYKFLPDGSQPIVSPDQLIEPQWNDFVAGRDAALEWVLAQ